jgi:VCBS repeat-containing protein
MDRFVQKCKNLLVARQWAIVFMVLAGMGKMGHTQDLLFTENFEGDTTDFFWNHFNDLGNDFFMVGLPNYGNLTDPFTNYEGTKVLLAEHVDASDNPLGAGSPAFLVLPAQDVHTYDSVTISFLLGAEDSDGGFYKPDRYVKMQYAFDGDSATRAGGVNSGNYAEFAAFYGGWGATSPSYDTLLAEDTDLDGLADANYVTDAMQRFAYTIPVTGNALSIRLEIFVYAYQDLAIDDIKIYGIISVDDTAPILITNNGLNIAEGQSKVIPIDSLEANDDNTANASLVYTITSAPANGRLEKATNPGVAVSSFTQQNVMDNVVQYVHNGGETISDSFVFKVSDVNGNELTGQSFSITVTPVNDAPTLSSATAQSMLEDGSLELTVAMTDGADVDGDALSLIVGSGANYSVQGVTITPDADFHGTLTVPVQVSDGELSSGSVDMTITVTAVNDAPTLSSATAQSMLEDGSLELTVAMTDGADVDGDALSLVVGSGANYSVQGVTISPDANFNGTLTVPVQVSDGDLSSGSVDMTITVTAVNDAPTLSSATAQSMLEDGSLELTVAMTDGADVDGDALSLVVGSGANYSVQGVTISPDANFNGTLTVPVQVSDGDLSSGSVDMTITVTPVNDAPTLSSATAQSMLEDGSLELTVAMTDGADVDGDALSLVVGSGANYSVQGVTISPDANFNGTLTVPVQVSDGGLSSGSVDMTITVTAVNDAPVAVKDSFAIENTEVLAVPSAQGVLQNDQDVEMDALHALLVAAPKNGTLTLAEDGSFAYESASDFIGIDTFYYAAYDGVDTSEAVVVTIVVTQGEEVVAIPNSSGNMNPNQLAPNAYKIANSNIWIGRTGWLCIYSANGTIEKRMLVFQGQTHFIDELGIHTFQGKTITLQPLH